MESDNFKPLPVPVTAVVEVLASEFEELELSSGTTSCSRALHFSKVLAKVFAAFAIFSVYQNLSRQFARLNFDKKTRHTFGQTAVFEPLGCKEGMPK